MLRVAVIMGSTRPHRICDGVASWVYQEASKRTEAEFELIDLRDFNLPLLDEPVSAGLSSSYQKLHTKRWSEKISTFDAFIFVTPEYNHGTSGVLKNAIDFLYREWNNKVAGFVGYGSVGGTRAVEALRLIMAELQVATVRTQVAFSFRHDFENYIILKAKPYHEKLLHKMIDEVLTWGSALRGLRREEEDIESNSEGYAGFQNEERSSL